MELEDVGGDGQERPFRGGLWRTPAQEAAIIQILLGEGEGAFGLNGTVDAQQLAFRGIDLVNNENEMYNAAVETFDRNLATHMKMMTFSLSRLVSQQGYAGPRVLSDGFVVELRGSDAILPEGLPGGLRISRSLIDLSLASGQLRTGHYTAVDDASDSVSMISDPEEADRTAVFELPAGKYFLSFGKISENLVYVNMVPESMLDDAIDTYVERNDDTVENESGSFGGMTLVVNVQGEDVTLLKAFGDAGSYRSLSDLGITADQILSRAPVLNVDDTSYSCNYSTIQGTWDSWENPLMIQMLPMAIIGGGASSNRPSSVTRWG